MREQQNVQEAKLDEILQTVQQQDTHGLIIRKVVGVIQEEVEQIKDVVCSCEFVVAITLLKPRGRNARAEEKKKARLFYYIYTISSWVAGVSRCVLRFAHKISALWRGTCMRFPFFPAQSYGSQC